MRHFFHKFGSASRDCGNRSERMGRGFGPRGFGGGFGGGGFGGGFRGEGRGGRGFGHGGLRLVILKLIEEKPSHGYELIKAIEERFKGQYSPSPGVIYPTLSWLEDEGFASVTPTDDGKKSYAITDAGKAFLTEKAAEVDRLFEMMGDETDPRGQYGQVMRAMHNLKSALRMRAVQGGLDKTQIEAIVDMIDDVARKIERL